MNYLSPFWLLLLCADFHVTNAEQKSAILFGSRMGAAYGYADLEYLEDLQEKGFEVDFTGELSELTWERLKQYNAVVLYKLPKGDQGKEIADAVARFIAAGGGVLLLPTEHNIYRHPLYEITHRYGVRVPTERMTETDPKLIASFDHMPTSGWPRVSSFFESMARLYSGFGQ